MKNITGIAPDSSNQHGGLPHIRIETTRGKRDILTGLTGFSNKFVYTKFNPSLLGEYDVVTNLKKTDTIESPYVFDEIKIDSSSTIYSSTALTAKQIGAVLTKSAFTPNNAVAFTVPKYPGTFVALNDGRAGFQSQTDSVIYLNGFTVSDTASINVT
jgi:hypothetical protein